METHWSTLFGGNKRLTDKDHGESAEGSADLSDSRRSIELYGKLLSFEQEVLEAMRSWAQNRPTELRRIIQRDEIDPMEAMIEQFQQRLSIWRERERRLRPE